MANPQIVQIVHAYIEGRNIIFGLDSVGRTWVSDGPRVKWHIYLGPIEDKVD